MLQALQALSLQVIDALAGARVHHVGLDFLYRGHPAEGHGDGVEEDAGIAFHEHEAQLAVLHLADVAGVGECQLLCVGLAGLKGLRETYRGARDVAPVGAHHVVVYESLVLGLCIFASLAPLAEDGLGGGVEGVVLVHFTSFRHTFQGACQ